MSRSQTARERVRTELVGEIKDEARAQLATHGAAGLSLRAVARELGMASSAMYRYFPSRDDLLTALIVDAYDALGAAAESTAERAAGPTRARWRAVCRGVRAWALAHRHEYALIYGSPVPAYRAPQQTVTSAARAALVLLDLVREAAASGSLAAAPDGPALPPGLAGQLREVAADHAPELPEAVLARLLVVWTQLFGMISFELFGHLVGTVDPGEEFFDHAVEQMADHLGLPPDDGIVNPSAIAGDR